MPMYGFTAERFITLLRQIEISMAQDRSALVAWRDAGILLQSYEINF